jgi:hypothetical protein
MSASFHTVFAADEHNNNNNNNNNVYFNVLTRVFFSVALQSLKDLELNSCRSQLQSQHKKIK